MPTDLLKPPLMPRQFLHTSRLGGKLVSAALAFFFVMLYVAGAELGYLLSFSGSFATFWPPSGIFLAALLLHKPCRWPGISLLALVANLFVDVGGNHYDAFSSLVIWVLMTFEALTAAWVLRRVTRGPFACESVQEIFVLALVGAFL